MSTLLMRCLSSRTQDMESSVSSMSAGWQLLSTALSNLSWSPYIVNMPVTGDMPSASYNDIIAVIVITDVIFSGSGSNIGSSCPKSKRCDELWTIGWFRSTVGRTPVFGRWSDPVLRSACSWRVTIIWVNRPLQVSQLGQLSLSSFRGR